MNEKPLFYPKHMARQYVSSCRPVSVRVRSKSHSDSPMKDVTNMCNNTKQEKMVKVTKKEVFAPKMTSSTVNLPSKAVLGSFEEQVQKKLADIFDVLDAKKNNRVRFQGNSYQNDSFDQFVLLSHGRGKP